MKEKLMSLVVFTLFVAGSLSAQVEQKPAADKAKRPRLTEEEMIQKQTERMTAALLLDDAAAAKFAPVYQQYLKEMSDIRKEDHRNAPAEEGEQPQKAEKKALTDAEIEARIEERFAQCRKILDTREKYYKEFKKMLTAKQIEKIFRQAPAQDGPRARKFGRIQTPMRQGQPPMHPQNCPMQDCPLQE